MIIFTNVKHVLVGSLIILLAFLFSGCSIGNVDYVKERAEKTWNNNGFELIGSQGYGMGIGIPFTYYGGAQVWYTVKRVGSDKTIYQGCLLRWKSEIHIYELSAIDAIKSK